jgi:hypothetical protein
MCRGVPSHSPVNRLVPSWAKDPKIGNRILCTSQSAWRAKAARLLGERRREEGRPSARTTTASRLRGRF